MTPDTVAALVFDAVGCLLAAAVVRVGQVWTDDTWREERWH
jgi:hypothetical protein